MERERDGKRETERDRQRDTLIIPFFPLSGEINVTKAQTQLGLDPVFFDVLGSNVNPLEKKQFHELSFYQRVWILRALCDHCLVSESLVRSLIGK
jgi:hypothetical protein